MDSRAAKREACGLVAAAIQGGLESGLLVVAEDDYPNPGDVAKVTAALVDLRAEMERRSLRGGGLR